MKEFASGEFIVELAKLDSNLADYLKSDFFKEISTIISKMRNTIHGAKLTTVAYQNGIDPEKSYVRIPNADAQVILDIGELATNMIQRWSGEY